MRQGGLQVRSGPLVPAQAGTQRWIPACAGMSGLICAALVFFLLAASAGKFDTVISLDVLEHLPDIAGELDFLASMLAPGGTLVLSAPVGGTESHPMHLEHRIDVAAHLRSRGLEDAKTFGLRWRSSEYMRKKSVFVFRKPAGIATEQVLIAPRISQRPVG